MKCFEIILMINYEFIIILLNVKMINDRFFYLKWLLEQAELSFSLTEDKSFPPAPTRLSKPTWVKKKSPTAAPTSPFSDKSVESY